VRRHLADVLAYRGRARRQRAAALDRMVADRRRPAARSPRNTLRSALLRNVLLKGEAVPAAKPPEIFDRDWEWSQLDRFVSDDQPGATLGIVSGRRRQGKTFLLESTCEFTGGFYYAATEAVPRPRPAAVRVR
jgi:hypothetical protein